MDHWREMDTPKNELNMEMDNIENISLRSQRIRTFSGRRSDPTVPEVAVSSSCEGPTPPQTTGGEHKMATVEEIQDLPVTVYTESLAGEEPETGVNTPPPR